MRVSPTTVGTFFCSIVRDTLEVDCAILNAGGIRGNTSYEGKKAFFFSDLMTELPFEIKLVVIKVPGKVLADAVAYSRLNARKSPPVEYGSYYMYVCIKRLVLYVLYVFIQGYFVCMYVCMYVCIQRLVLHV